MAKKEKFSGSLPSGKVVRSFARYYKEWQKVAKPFCEATGCGLAAFDPDILFGRWNLPGKLAFQIKQYFDLRESLARVMSSKEIDRWLNKPNKAFGDLTPLEMLRCGQIDRLLAMVYELESGVPT